MDIGNLPIYSGNKTTERNRDYNGQPVKKNPWDQIGDYEETPSNNTTVVDEDDEENYEQPKIVSKLKSKDTKKDSDEALSISQAALRDSQNKNQL
jgi:hypothetical protein